MSEKNDNAKKQLPLRLSAKLYAALAEWADDEFRSVNGQRTATTAVLSHFR